MQQQTVVLITGVSSGIGRAAAEHFARTGCIVYGSVRHLAGATPLTAVELVEMDIRDAASVQRAVDGIIARAGRIDVLVNNAGANLVGAIEETSVDEAAALFDINVLGILRTVQAVLPHMRTRPGPHRQCQLGAGVPAGAVHGRVCGLQTCGGRVVGNAGS